MSYEKNAGAMLTLVEEHPGEDFLRALPTRALRHIMETEAGGSLAGARRRLGQGRFREG